ncbi:hypothetical protein HK405_001338, partial [Cladochytrium tenue]
METTATPTASVASSVSMGDDKGLGPTEASSVSIGEDKGLGSTEPYVVCVESGSSSSEKDSGGSTLTVEVSVGSAYKSVYASFVDELFLNHPDSVARNHLHLPAFLAALIIVASSVVNFTGATSLNLLFWNGKWALTLFFMIRAHLLFSRFKTEGNADADYRVVSLMFFSMPLVLLPPVIIIAFTQWRLCDDGLLQPAVVVATSIFNHSTTTAATAFDANMVAVVPQ